MKRLIALVFLLVALRTDAAMMDSARWDWESYRWQTNIVTSSGTISASSYLTGTRFMNQVKMWGVRPRLGRVGLYLGDNTNAMTCPIITDWSGGTVINDDLIAFAAADYTEATGLTGNTTTKVLRCSKATGLNLSTFSNGQNLHFAAYVRTASNEASDIMGTGGVSGTYGMAISNAGVTYVFMGANTANAVDSTGSGFCLTTRRSSSLGVTYRNSVAIVTDSAADSGTLGGEACIVHAINISGAFVANTSRTLSYYGIGFSIAANLVTPYNVAVLNVQKAVGRAL